MGPKSRTVAGQEGGSTVFSAQRDWQGSPDENGCPAVGTLGAIMGQGKEQLHCTLENRYRGKKNKPPVTFSQWMRDQKNPKRSLLSWQNESKLTKKENKWH